MRVLKKGRKLVLLELTSEKIGSEFIISLPRDEWFTLIDKLGGKIKYWHGIDMAVLRKGYCFFYIFCRK